MRWFFSSQNAVTEKKPPNFYICKVCRGGKLIHVHSDEQLENESIITFCPVCDHACMQCYAYSAKKHP